MAHQVFVIHAPQDAEAASRVCEMLEADGTHCYPASREAPAGNDRAAETLDAIRASDLVVLVFSAAANASPEVLHDMETAVAQKRPVLPVRLDDAVPNAALRRYLDLAAQPETAGLTESATSDAAKGSESGPSAEAARSRRPSRRTLLIALASAALVVAVGFGPRSGPGPDRPSGDLDRTPALGSTPRGKGGKHDGGRPVQQQDGLVRRRDRRKRPQRHLGLQSRRQQLERT
ncbi:MAG: toll/interleukin-1 receptor domain-containing protein [Thermoleophilia bacterium]|nr:toll/interleukin-1 receptor domain-containing protein [Thermoleophilia bacterium]